jgi:hypothetical protein
MLSEAINYGYEIQLKDSTPFFSPIDILLDSVIDIFLILRKMFSEGSTSSKPNIGIGFSDVSQDVLGNPKQFRITYPGKYYWDPLAEELFFQLAETFVKIKNQESLKQSFHDFVEFLGFNPHRKVRTSKQKRRANFFWWRRQQRR